MNLSNFLVVFVTLPLIFSIFAIVYGVNILAIGAAVFFLGGLSYFASELIHSGDGGGKRGRKVKRLNVQNTFGVDSKAKIYEKSPNIALIDLKARIISSIYFKRLR